MAEILFLCHRIPYPPNKGDKIRSWHILCHLASKHTVHLACFVDAAEDWAHRDTVQRRSGDCYFQRLGPSALRWRNLVGLAMGQSVTESHYKSEALKRWVNELVARRPIAGVYVFSSAMAQYLSAVTGPNVRTVVDFVDLDSEKWRQYASHRKPPMRWLYDLEARRLSAFERWAARHSDVSIFVTDNEREAFRRLAPESSNKAVTVRNGVDIEYFSPDRSYENPFRTGDRSIVFTGAMGYWANVDAVTWFATEVLPELRVREPSAEFWIVGAGPSHAV
jgi:sugar transferase (PEP-CTERM/EpsH1 system associated)